jgi:hypothetical protein
MRWLLKLAPIAALLALVILLVLTATAPPLYS